MQLGRRSDVVGLASHLFTLDEHVFDLSSPHGHLLLHAPHQLDVRTFNARRTTERRPTPDQPCGNVEPAVQPAFHDADTDTDIFADILARIVARMSACRSACHRNNFNRACRTCRRESSLGSRCRGMRVLLRCRVTSSNFGTRTLSARCEMCTGYEAVAVLCDWEGNRTSSIAPTMRHTAFAVYPPMVSMP